MKWSVLSNFMKSTESSNEEKTNQGADMIWRKQKITYYVPSTNEQKQQCSSLKLLNVIVLQSSATEFDRNHSNFKNKGRPTCPTQPPPTLTRGKRDFIPSWYSSGLKIQVPTFLTHSVNYIFPLSHTKTFLRQDFRGKKIPWEYQRTQFLCKN